MSNLRVTIGAIFFICIMLSGFSDSWGSELRCRCVKYYYGIPWTATCVYLEPRSIACNHHELIVYDGSIKKTCVRVANPSAFKNVNKVAWFTVKREGQGNQLKLKRHNGSCSVVH
ncbi:Rh158.1 [macacine betaherpesvirus 3]|nr:Rh158.1 [macacine betaherpesvirus 3]